MQGQTQGGTEEIAANPGRPTLSTPATLTPVGFLQFESGVLTARHSPEFAAQTNINEVMRIALTRRFQLVALLQPISHYKADRQTRTTGISGVSVAAQAVLYAGEGARPTLSLNYGRGIYGGSAPDFDVGSPRNSLLFLASADVKGFHYDANLYGNDLAQNTVHRAQSGQSLSITHPLTNKLQITGELWHFTQPFLRSHAAGSLWAISYSASKKLVFDGGFDRGLTATSTRWQVFAGFTYLLPHKLWR